MTYVNMMWSGREWIKERMLRWENPTTSTSTLVLTSSCQTGRLTERQTECFEEEMLVACTNQQRHPGLAIIMAFTDGLHTTK